MQRGLPAERAGTTDWAKGARVARVLVAGLLLAALIALLVDTMSFIEEISDPPFGEPASAIQVTQVYAERIFYAVIVIGAGVLVYIASRFAE